MRSPSRRSWGPFLYFPITGLTAAQLPAPPRPPSSCAPLRLVPSSLWPMPPLVPFLVGKPPAASCRQRLRCLRRGAAVGACGGAERVRIRHRCRLRQRAGRAEGARSVSPACGCGGGVVMTAGELPASNQRTSSYFAPAPPHHRSRAPMAGLGTTGWARTPTGLCCCLCSPRSSSARAWR